MEREPESSIPMLTPSDFYMQREFSELHEHQNVPSLPNSGINYQLNFRGSSSEQGLVVDPTSDIISDGSGVGGLLSMQPSPTPMRRKRGRPRKYGVEAKMLPDRSSVLVTPRVMKTLTEKRGRGRPSGSGSGRKLPLTSFGKFMSGSAGGGFTPHVISVATGEDISSKLTAFSQQRRRSFCILSANGAVSTVSLGQPSTSITYEGHFDILCMSGSFLLLGNDGFRERSCGLSITLASSDGRVIGGPVAGMLIAASPVQVIVGSFMWTTPKTIPKNSEGNEGGRDLEQYVVDNTTMIGQPSGQRSQNLSSPTSSMGPRDSSETLDIRNSHMDTDLMHG